MVTQFEGFIAQANFGPLSVFADCTQQQIDRAKKDRSVIRYPAKTKIENSMDQSLLGNVPNLILKKFR